LPDSVIVPTSCDVWSLINPSVRSIQASERLPGTLGS
jgi:hypothetical protein